MRFSLLRTIMIGANGSFLHIFYIEKVIVHKEVIESQHYNRRPPWHFVLFIFLYIQHRCLKRRDEGIICGHARGPWISQNPSFTSYLSDFPLHIFTHPTI